jgi:hypothetical protein
MRRTSVTLTRGGAAVAVQQHHVDTLVRALRTSGSAAADDIADELTALSVAGVRLDLLPTPAELEALIDVLVRLTLTRTPDGTFGRILSAARDRERA